MKRLTVHSSCGDLVIDPETGSIIESNYDNDGITIVEFNVKEWAEFYPDEKLSDLQSIDILDLGYTFSRPGPVVPGESLYQPPELSARYDMLKDKAERLSSSLRIVRDKARKMCERAVAGSSTEDLEEAIAASEQILPSMGLQTTLTPRFTSFVVTLDSESLARLQRCDKSGQPVENMLSRVIQRSVTTMECNPHLIAPSKKDCAP